MKKISNILKLIPLLILPLFFTSCIDYVQSLSYKNGKYQVYCKVTFSKALFEYAGMDADSLTEAMTDELDENQTYATVSTDTEIGVEIRTEVEPNTEDEKLKEMLPRVSGKTYFIPFFLGGQAPAMQEKMGSSDPSTAQIANMMLSSAKCRVFLSKKLVPVIKSAFFDGDEIVNVDAFDYGENYCLEIPLTVLTTPRETDFSIITIIGE